MKALMKISLNSASLAIRERNPSPLNSKNSPDSVTRPSTRQRWPEIMVISPVNSPGPCFAMGRSPARSGCTISIAPESRTKKGTLTSPGSNRISPGLTRRTSLNARTRLICAGLRTGKACVRASSALGIGEEDIFAP